MFSQILNCAIKLKTDGDIRCVEPSMDKTTLASRVEHLGKGEILNPVFDIFSASEHDDNTVQRTMVSHKSYDISDLILKVCYLLEQGQIGTKFAVPIDQKILTAVHDHAV